MAARVVLVRLEMMVDGADGRDRVWLLLLEVMVVLVLVQVRLACVAVALNGGRIVV